MKKRIITAAVLIPLLSLLVLAAPKILAAVVLGVLLMIGEVELLYITGLIRHVRMVCYCAVSAFAICIWSIYGAVSAWLYVIVISLWVLLFSELMLNHVKISIEMVSVCFFAGFVVPYLLSSVVRILSFSNGRFMVVVPFVVAFLSDAGAYFAGLRFGRHKLAPVVSPNKTIEGVVGGFAAAIAGMLIYAVILQAGFRFHVNYGAALLYAILGAGVDVFSDLSFSIIKRQTGIKDYGNLLPGHGGVYDRLDSMVLVAPLMEALIVLLPLAV